MLFSSCFKAQTGCNCGSSPARYKRRLSSLVAIAVAFLLLASAVGSLVSGSDRPSQDPQNVHSYLNVLPTPGSSQSPVATGYVAPASTLPSSDPGRIIKSMNFSETGGVYPVPIQGAYDPATGMIYTGAISPISPYPSYLTEANVSSVSLPGKTITLSYTGYVEALDSSNRNLTVVESNLTSGGISDNFIQQVDPATGSLLPALDMGLTSYLGDPAAALNDPLNGLVYILTTNQATSYGRSNLSVYDPQTNLITTSLLVNMSTTGFYPYSMAFNSNYSKLFVLGTYHDFSSGSYWLAVIALNTSDYSSYMINTPITFAKQFAQAPGGIAFDPYDNLIYFSYNSQILTNSTNANYVTEGIGLINATTESYVLNFSLPNVYVPISPALYPYSPSVAGTLTYDPNNHDLYLTQSGLPWETIFNEYYLLNRTIAVINGTSPTSANPVALLTGPDYPIGGLFIPSQSSGDGSLWFPVYNQNSTGPYGGFMVAGIPPSINSFSAMPSVIDEGSSTTISSSVSFGVGAISYAYSGLPSGMVSKNTDMISGTPSATGSYIITLTVTDAVGESVSTTTMLTVNKPLSAAASTQASDADAGQVVSFTVTVSGGTSPYTEQWAFGDGGTATGLSVFHVYNASGRYSVSVVVKDAVGSIFIANLTETISLPPANLTISTSRDVTDVGVPVMFSAESQYGSSPVSYSWSMGDGGTSSATTFTYAYSAPGEYKVTLTVRDSAGVSSTTSYSILVLPDPHATIILSPSTIAAGAMVTISSNVSGGLGPYIYLWNFGDGNQSTQPSPQHAYARTGSYTVSLRVTDATGYSTTASFNVTVVRSASGVSSGGGLSSEQSYLMLGAGLAAGIVIGAIAGLVLASRRRKPPASP